MEKVTKIVDANVVDEQTVDSKTVAQEKPEGFFTRARKKAGAWLCRDKLLTTKGKVIVTTLLVGGAAGAAYLILKKTGAGEVVQGVITEDAAKLLTEAGDLTDLSAANVDLVSLPELSDVTITTF